ncbi:MAG TPA: polymer-forming cytoskeletal protein [Longimicrobiales bacterium]|nr:polymer-forming cytoskeletal protein [Longimicrobiales bacterium]
MIQVLLAVALLAPAGLSAQAVQVRGRGDIDNDIFLRDFVRRGTFTLVTRDTVIGQGQTVTGDVLVARATLRLDGTVTGDIVVVDGNVFLRPTARVGGRVHNVGGGLYPSELASVEGGVRSEPNAPYLASVADDGSVVITGMVQSSSLVPAGFSGLLEPMYDRVNGLTISAGASLMLPRMGSVQPVATARADYYSQRGDFGGLGELALERRRTALAAGFERSWITNERWIRADLSNSIGALFQGKDRRDYYAADRAFVEVRRLLEQGPRTTTAFLRGQVEDATSLHAGSPWSLFGNLDKRANLPIDDGRVSSLIAGADMEWLDASFVVEASGRLEFAADALDGDHAFNRFLTRIEWAMPALADHTLEIDAQLQGPLPGTESLPRQRWSFVGGSGTLYTFEDAQFRGDRLVMVETTYSVPLPARLRLRLLGLPSLDLMHLTGMAWSKDEPRSFEQNIGARLRYSIAWVRVMANPRDLGGAEFGVGVNLPRKAFPWQQPPE